MAEYPTISGGYWEYGADSAYPVFGVQTDDGETPDYVLEDFEDDSLSEYGGDLSDFTIQQQDVLEGKYSLTATDSWSAIGDSGGDIATPRTSSPTEYRARIYCEGGGEAVVLFCVQSESAPYTNCYAVMANANDGTLWLLVRNNGSTEVLDQIFAPIEPDTEYTVYLTLSTEGINAGIYDKSGTEIGATDSYRDTTFSGGGLGWRVGPDAPVIFDYATYHSGSMGDLNAIEGRIDGFEDGTLGEYEVRQADSGAVYSAEPAAALDGNYGLEMQDFAQLFTAPGMGLDRYIGDEVPIEVHFAPQDVAGEAYSILLCPYFHGGDSMDYYYHLEFLMDAGAMRIRKFHIGAPDGDEEWTLHGSGTNESHYAATADGTIDWTADNWYRAEITLDQSVPKIRAELYDAGSDAYLGYVEQTDDGEYMADENGFGFICSDTGHWYADEVREI